MNRTMLIDGNNLLARADFASKGKHVAMSVGEVNTAALVIFINMLSKYVRLFEPTHLAVMWDAGHTMRDEAYPAYKSNRNKHEDGAEDTVPFALAKEFLTWAGVPHKMHIGWEADDLIAATTRQCIGDVAIVSGDKDLLQLLRSTPDYSVVQYRVPDDEPWTSERFYQQHGYSTGNAAMVHALVGDTSDGVPGLRGIGPKRAVALLEKAGWSWEALLGLLGPEEAAEARTMRSLVDLRDLEYPTWFMLAHRGAPEFEPTKIAPPGVMNDGSYASVNLREFCNRYLLNSVRDRLISGTLWADRNTTSEDLFEEVDFG